MGEARESYLGEACGRNRRGLKGLVEVFGRHRKVMKCIGDAYTWETCEDLGGMDKSWKAWERHLGGVGGFGRQRQGLKGMEEAFGRGGRSWEAGTSHGD